MACVKSRSRQCTYSIRDSLRVHPSQMPHSPSIVKTAYNWIIILIVTVYILYTCTIEFSPHACTLCSTYKATLIVCVCIVCVLSTFIHSYRTHTIQNDLNTLTQWSLMSKLCFNASKCWHLQFYTLATSFTSNYYLNGSPIPSTDQIQGLGVMFSGNLS